MMKTRAVAAAVSVCNVRNNKSCCRPLLLTPAVVWVAEFLVVRCCYEMYLAHSVLRRLTRVDAQDSVLEEFCAGVFFMLELRRHPCAIVGRTRFFNVATEDVFSA